MRIKIKADNLPKYHSTGAAGFDLHAHLPPNGVMSVLRGETKLVPTGLYIEVPDGYELQIRPRSSLGRVGVLVPNSPGTIDSDYRGEIQVLLLNLGPTAFAVKHGDRVAQAVLCPVVRAEFEQVDELTTTSRGTGGFGSTGR